MSYILQTPADVNQLIYQNYYQQQNKHFTRNALQEMCVEFQKAIFWKIWKTGFFQIIVSANWYDACLTNLLNENALSVIKMIMLQMLIN